MSTSVYESERVERNDFLIVLMVLDIALACGWQVLSSKLLALPFAGSAATFWIAPVAAVIVAIALEKRGHERAAGTVGVFPLVFAVLMAVVYAA